jgi:hypothetical protein
MHVCVDRYLNRRQDEAVAFACRHNPANVHPVQMALETGKKWAPGTVIPCYFMEGTAIQQEKVVAQAKKWETFANIKLNFVNDPNADVRIAFHPSDGSWSYIGVECKFAPKNENTVNFGWLTDTTDDLEYQRVVVHEFGHVLGCIHEHQSPAGNIPWNKDAVYKFYEGPPNNWTKDDVDANLFQKYDASQTQFSALDTHSIMMYAIPKELTLGGYEVGWNTDMSPMDKSFIAQAYPANVPITPPANTLILGGGPVGGFLNSVDEMGQFTFNVPFTGSGTYQFTTNPLTMWINVRTAHGIIKYSKGNLIVKLGPGDYETRVRFSIQHSGPYTISTKKIGK